MLNELAGALRKKQKKKSDRVYEKVRAIRLFRPLTRFHSVADVVRALLSLDEGDETEKEAVVKRLVDHGGDFMRAYCNLRGKTFKQLDDTTAYTTEKGDGSVRGTLVLFSDTAWVYEPVRDNDDDNENNENDNEDDGGGTRGERNEKEEAAATAKKDRCRSILLLGGKWQELRRDMPPAYGKAVGQLGSVFLDVEGLKDRSWGDVFVNLLHAADLPFPDDDRQRMLDEFATPDGKFVLWGYANGNKPRLVVTLPVCAITTRVSNEEMMKALAAYVQQKIAS